MLIIFSYQFKTKPNVDARLPLFSGQNPVSFPRLAHSFYTELIFGINKITFHIKMFSLTSWFPRTCKELKMPETDG